VKIIHPSPGQSKGKQYVHMYVPKVSIFCRKMFFEFSKISSPAVTSNENASNLFTNFASHLVFQTKVTQPFYGSEHDLWVFLEFCFFNISTRAT
jgi:hypothetical protein